MSELPPNSRVHAFSNDALGDLDAVGVADAIRAGDISAREATEAAIARAEQVDPGLNALVVRDFERALDQADHPVPGVFSGVPSVIKDNTDVIGLPHATRVRGGPGTRRQGRRGLHHPDAVHRRRRHRQVDDAGVRFQREHRVREPPADPEPVEP